MNNLTKHQKIINALYAFFVYNSEKNVRYNISNNVCTFFYISRISHCIIL